MLRKASLPGGWDKRGRTEYRAVPFLLFYVCIASSKGAAGCRGCGKELADGGVEAGGGNKHYSVSFGSYCVFCRWDEVLLKETETERQI